MCVRECLHIGVCARARGFCADAGARAGAHTCLRAYVRAGAREYVRVCENADMLCVRARVSACRCASVGGLAYKRPSSKKFIIGSSIRLHQSLEWDHHNKNILLDCLNIILVTKGHRPSH